MSLAGRGTCGGDELKALISTEVFRLLVKINLHACTCNKPIQNLDFGWGHCTQCLRAIILATKANDNLNG